MRQGEIKYNFGNLFLFLHQESKIANAEKNEGESELRDALLSKAEYLTKIGMKEEAVEAIRWILESIFTSQTHTRPSHKC